MKVKELIEQLAKMPQNAEVFGWGYPDEGDHSIEEVKVCTRRDKCPHPYQMKEYYCKGDSQAAYYLKEHPEETEVVVLMN